VDAFDSKDLPSHHALLELGMRNLEGLDLSMAEAGEFELIALPLRLVDVDSSPVRAVLRTLE
jgi:arylformamidase